MNTAAWYDVREKLGDARVRKLAPIGVAALLALVAVSAAIMLSASATANEIEIASSDDTANSEDAETPAITLFVHVSGAVAAPGLYELADGSRVADAVQAAGGFADDADSDSCNLARIIEDGEHIVISRQGEASQPSADTAAQSATQSGRININTATAAQLESLPGIGEATAAKIVSDREANGPFKTVEDLTRVSGIGAKKLEALADLVCV